MRVRKCSRKSILGLVLSCILLSFNYSCRPGRIDQYDVVVYGGTPAGVTAAIQSSKMGKKVILLEPTSHVGGIVVEGLGGTDIDNHSGFQNSVALGGLALDFYKRIAKAYGRLEKLEKSLLDKDKHPELWRFEPHVAERIIWEWLSENGVEVVLQAALKESKDAVKKSGTEILSVKTDKGKFNGKVFIDATVEGDLLAASEISYIVGREANETYGETRNGIREHTTHGQLSVRVDPYVVPGNPTSGTIQGVLDEPLGIPGDADHRIQAYCFRVCLTNAPENMIPFSKPENYKRENYELALRYLRGGGRLYRPSSNIPNKKSDFNGGGGISHNLNGMNHGYPEGNREERKKILDFHQYFTQGFFYFLANDPEVAELDPHLQQEWKKWGLPKDEFQDNDGWPRMFYVRDARRMISDYVITEHHAYRENGVLVDDPVAIAYWPPDVHNVRTIVKDGVAYNEGFVFGGDWWKPFSISYRALIPKRSECTNLLTPTCPSSSHIAYGAIRIEWTFMSLGQAVGTAASFAVDSGVPVQDVDYCQLSRQLKRDGQILNL